MKRSKQEMGNALFKLLSELSFMPHLEVLPGPESITVSAETPPVDQQMTNVEMVASPSFKDTHLQSRSSMVETETLQDNTEHDVIAGSVDQYH